MSPGTTGETANPFHVPSSYYYFFSAWAPDVPKATELSVRIRATLSAECACRVLLGNPEETWSHVGHPKVRCFFLWTHGERALEQSPPSKEWHLPGGSSKSVGFWVSFDGAPIRERG